MKFVPTPLGGAFVIEPERVADERGFFARTFCRDEFGAHGLQQDFVQCNVSFNAKRGILRGMHFQLAPHAEVKLVRCTRGAIFDVIIDLRRDSPTYTRWFGVELDSENRQLLYIPAGFAHGFQTLADGSEVFYQMGAMYRADAGRGVRWNDPVFGIAWPLTDPVLSARDASYPDFAAYRAFDDS